MDVKINAQTMTHSNIFCYIVCIFIYTYLFIYFTIVVVVWSEPPKRGQHNDLSNYPTEKRERENTNRRRRCEKKQVIIGMFILIYHIFSIFMNMSNLSSSFIHTMGAQQPSKYFHLWVHKIFQPNVFIFNIYAHILRVRKRDRHLKHSILITEEMVYVSFDVSFSFQQHHIVCDAMRCIAFCFVHWQRDVHTWHPGTIFFILSISDARVYLHVWAQAYNSYHALHFVFAGVFLFLNNWICMRCCHSTPNTIENHKHTHNTVFQMKLVRAF